ncbi:MAG: polysaccharide deacetylase family protein [Rhodospirillaceae bacterium]|nr:polysaccharide deacetylase family protein [Rhodospirillaceae bacterium]
MTQTAISPTGPYLAVTFDDHYIDDWFDAADIFRAHGARVTFYAYGFPHVPQKAITKFYGLIGQGHEIGCHTSSHINAVETAEKIGLENYVKSEIVECINGMRIFGFTPPSFSYPYSKRSAELDAAIIPYFTTIRARADTFAEAMTWEQTKPLIKSRNADLVRADGATLRTADDVVHELRLAAQGQRSMAIDAHGISDKDDAGYHHITRRGLDYILWNARRLGFVFVTASEFIGAAR